MIPIEVVHPVAAELGEGPLWHPDEGVLYWVDIATQRVLRVSMGGELESRTFDTPVTALALRARGGLVAATRDGFASLAFADGRLDTLATADSSPERRMNDGGCDPLGQFWAGSMRFDLSDGDGTLYRLDAELKVHREIEAVGISNGLDWSPDGSQLYFVDSLAYRVDVLEVDSLSGRVAARAPLVVVDATEGMPDGLTVDADGNLWLAMYGGHEIRCYSAAGGLLERVTVPAASPTSLCFGGDDLADLFITTAAGSTLSPDDPDAGRLLCCRPGSRGRPSYAFVG